MSIEVVCPRGHQLKVKDQHAGRTVKCPKCKSNIHIPGPEHEIPGGLVRGILNPGEVAGDVWEFIDDLSDESGVIHPDHGQKGDPAEPEKKTEVYGELVPLKGGSKIPLLKPLVSVGRQKSCDVVLRHRNISASHAQLRLIDGQWHVLDLKSTNGVKVNGKPVQRERLDPGDVVAFAKHEFFINYAKV